jgi:hypothetical protein
MSSQTLTMADAAAIAEVLRMAESNAKVKWLREDGAIREGVARAITHDGGGFYPVNADVRDAYLWITTWQTEIWMPLAEVVPMVRRHEFVVREAA